MKRLLLTSILLLVLTSPCFAQGTLVMETYYPSPEGYYQQLNIGQWLHIDAVALPANCVIGDIAMDVSGYLYNCYDTDIWTPAGVWNKASDGSIYFWETPDHGSIYFTPFVGIGTSSPSATLHVAGDGSILAEGSGGSFPTISSTTFMLWNPAQAAFRAGTATAGQWDEINIGTNSVAFGVDNIASGLQAVVAGGTGNTNSGTIDSAIGGGAGNSITDSNNGVISGGTGNTIDTSTLNATISGGNNNSVGANTAASTVGGGEGNDVPGNYSVISGGQNNTVSGDFASIGGGQTNIISGTYSTIAGGGGDPNAGQIGHNIAGDWSLIGGGVDNIVQADYGVVAGGDKNTIIGGFANWSFIGGGFQNVIQEDQGAAGFGEYNVIVGGKDNLIDSTGGLIADFSVIAGGQFNNIDASYAFIGGGGATDSAPGNTVTNDFSSIVGGEVNTVSATHSVIGGGTGHNINLGANFSSILGGQNNSVNSLHGTVAGGLNNDVVGQYSFVAGRGQTANGQGSFQFGDSAVGVATNGDQTAFFYPEGSGHLIINSNSSLGNALEVTGDSLLTGNLTVTGNIGVNSLVTTGTVTIGSVPAGMVTGIGIDADNVVTQLDHAENFPTSDRGAKAGDIMVIDSMADIQLTRSSQPYDKNVAGIVSFSPGVLLEGNSMKFAPDPRKIKKEGEVPLALSGRVYCNVTLENGPIERGDMLTTSSTPGHAMKATDRDKSFGAIVGKALEPFDGGEDGETTGRIVVLVTLQ